MGMYRSSLAKPLSSLQALERVGHRGWTYEHNLGNKRRSKLLARWHPEKCQRANTDGMKLTNRECVETATAGGVSEESIIGR